jgi:dTDP-glucose pyrophosphorylase
MYDLVLTMAGRGQRFVDAGYDLPKAAIPAHGHPLLWWSVLGIRHLVAPDSAPVFVVRAEDRLDDLVASVCRDLGLRAPELVAVDETTDGQATTALLGVDRLDSGRPFMVFNADTHIREDALRAPAFGEAWVPYFVAEGDAWSFVAIDEAGRVHEVAEKRRISPYATVGLYTFPSAERYRELYRECFEGERDVTVRGERYIAPMYQVAIDEGWVVAATGIEPGDVVPLGTPAELTAFEAVPAP